MPQAVDCELLLYADDTCLIFQHKDITEIESALNKNFSMLCDWFVDNKLSIHFGEDKRKTVAPNTSWTTSLFFSTNFPTFAEHLFLNSTWL